MGAWGTESCSSDSCWDLLGDMGIDNIHEMNQAEVDVACNCLIVIADRIEDDPYAKADVIGCVIWFLRQGLTVSADLLVKAIALAEQLVEHKPYLEDWRDPEERHDQLLVEINDFQTALNNGGKIEEKHVPGLFEKILKGLNGEGK